MNNIEITLTKKEADYVKTMLLNNTYKIQAICKKREEMKEFFRENTVLNGNISRKITNAIKVSVVREEQA
ncbi:TPA: hypothetical protein LWK93_002563 [Listeria monocytogenes]|uniref:hypothetical protein n=1 Tax=Listeria monocytogenes TaxID=1639 RepID=UPI000A34E994|nr:hypothetical protein [Listeria monocytogenes]HAA6692256.1 hypothetical protein [Listeria monocytogenes]HBL5587258.1 hypothetical protein [Listeria monocytogenes]HBM3500961.1 hypothetical protein [Listeria monocytogenes]HBM4148485.1 hypothetical protein [Listeria monocytogenes]HBM4580589.1 hypothetical protein [Listeria monocytogenes]